MRSTRRNTHAIGSRCRRRNRRSLSANTTGAVLLAEGDVRGGLSLLRNACATWQDLDAPYEAARARVLIALACRRLGDDDGAEMEMVAARSVFEALGAVPDLARVEELSGTAGPEAAAG